MKSFLITIALCTVVGLSANCMAQETDTPEVPTSQQSQEVAPGTSQEVAPDVSPMEKIQGKVDEIADTVNKNEKAQEVSAGILQPIYQAAEWFAFPMFYWVAFMLMVAGVVSFAGQVVLAKLFLLLSGSINLKEIIADAMGLLISVVGLVLTTQAATENSDFTRTPFMVLSAAAVGAVLGLVTYWWGQSQEFAARRGERSASKQNSGNRAKM